jgi:formylglycine-generating enzyme required for sulfatase activity
VSWQNVTDEYLPWLSRKTGKSYRLLSEAEWEYAARAGTKTRYSFGHTIGKDQANYSGIGTVAVGSRPPNAFGLHDMHGNANEWVQDCWNRDYAGAPSDGSAWVTGDCNCRVIRGGSWGGEAQWLRSASRGKDCTNFFPVNAFGFRVARALTITP